MASKVEVFNLALSLCGQTSLVTDPEGDRNVGAAQCRLWLPFVLDALIAAAPWPSSRRYARLALVAERGPGVWLAGGPTPARHFAYAAPVDMVQPIHLQSYGTFEYTSGVISTDERTPILYYNARPEDVSSWDPQLTQAVIYSLAAAVARAVTGKPEIVQDNYQIAAQRVEEMRASAANFDDHAEESLPDWIAVRGYADQYAGRFIYPFSTFSMEYSR